MLPNIQVKPCLITLKSMYTIVNCYVITGKKNRKQKLMLDATTAALQYKNVMLQQQPLILLKQLKQ